MSYRRDRSAIARSIAERLRREGVDVFLDADQLRKGDFAEQLRAAVAASDVFLAVLTHGSLQRCRADEDDFCRLEMRFALEAKTTIIPIAEDRAVSMSADDYPAELRELSRLQAVYYSHEQFDVFITQLLAFMSASSKTELLQRWHTANEAERSPAYRAWLSDRLLPGVAQLPGVEVFPSVGSVRYPVLVLRDAEPQRVFHHDRTAHVLSSPLRDPDEITYRDGIPQEPSWLRSQEQKEYFGLLASSESVKRWNMRGFALQTLQLDHAGRVMGSESVLSTYGENCLTSHVLGYQLVREYLDGAEPLERPTLRFLPRAEGYDVALHGADIYPLVSVQAIVVVRHTDDSWTMLVMQRSHGVAAAAGFWQFPPAGGFEILGSEDEDAFVVRRQFDLRQALLREFLEEVWGDDDLTSANEVNPDLQGSPGYRITLEALAAERLSVHLLGVVVDAVSLRSEFSFLVVMDDPGLRSMEYQTESVGVARWLKRSSEARRLFEFSLAEVEEHLHDDGPWNPSSVGLFLLFREALESRWLTQKYPWLKR